MLDAAHIIIADAGKAGRANGKDHIRMARPRRFQKGWLFKRGKAWAARWWEDVIDEDGKPGRVRRYATFGEVPKHDAQNQLDEMLRPLNHGKHRPQSMMMFEQFVRERWVPGEMSLLDAVSLKLDKAAVERLGQCSQERPGSAATYAAKLRLHVLPAFGRMRLSEISRWDVQRFLSEKLRQGHSGAHVHAMRATLSKVMQAAVRWELLTENPARGCRIASREPVKESVHLNPSQVQQLVTVLTEPCRSVVLLAVLSGLRIGEILALRWGRVDFLGGTLSVEESFSEWFGPPKTRHSRRIIPMSSTLRQVLETQRARTPRRNPSDLVFATFKGTPLSSKNLRNRVLEPARKALNLPRISWHSFRHTHATWLSTVGVSPRDAQMILGHGDVETTLKVYTHPIAEAQRDAMERIAGVLDTFGHKTTSPGDCRVAPVN